MILCPPLPLPSTTCAPVPLLFPCPSAPSHACCPAPGCHWPRSWHGGLMWGGVAAATPGQGRGHRRGGAPRCPSLPEALLLRLRAGRGRVHSVHAGEDSHGGAGTVLPGGGGGGGRPAGAAAPGAVHALLVSCRLPRGVAQCGPPPPVAHAPHGAAGAHQGCRPQRVLCCILSNPCAARQQRGF